MSEHDTGSPVVTVAAALDAAREALAEWTRLDAEHDHLNAEANRAFHAWQLVLVESGVYSIAIESEQFRSSERISARAREAYREMKPAQEAFYFALGRLSDLRRKEGTTPA